MFSYLYFFLSYEEKHKKSDSDDSAPQKVWNCKMSTTNK